MENLTNIELARLAFANTNILTTFKNDDNIKEVLIGKVEILKKDKENYLRVLKQYLKILNKNIQQNQTNAKQDQINIIIEQQLKNPLEFLINILKQNYLNQIKALEDYIKLIKQTDKLNDFQNQVIFEIKKLQEETGNIEQKFDENMSKIEVITNTISFLESLKENFEFIVDDVKNFDNIINKINSNKNENSINYYITKVKNGNNEHVILVLQEKTNIAVFDSLGIGKISDDIFNKLKNKLEINKELNIQRNSEHLQYTSGCCEMFSIDMAIYLSRLLYFNHLSHKYEQFYGCILERISVDKKNDNFYKLPEILASGLTELIFSKDTKSQTPLAKANDLLQLTKNIKKNDFLYSISFDNKPIMFSDIFKLDNIIKIFEVNFDEILLYEYNKDKEEKDKIDLKQLQKVKKIIADNKFKKVGDYEQFKEAFDIIYKDIINYINFISIFDFIVKTEENFKTLKSGIEYYNQLQAIHDLEKKELKQGQKSKLETFLI